MHRFFVDHIDPNRILLDQEESKHLRKVLRIKAGEQVEITDGKGLLVMAEVLDSDAKQVLLKPINVLQKEKASFGIHLAVAPTKNLNRWEFFVEKATELGIDQISPICSSNSERTVLKRERQVRILKSAVKQSQKIVIPKMPELQHFKDFLEQDFEGDKFIAHCDSSIDRKPLAQALTKGNPATVLIGPEGDFSKDEIEHALGKGYQSVSLGKSRLRTETAAIVACHTLHIIHA